MDDALRPGYRPAVSSRRCWRSPTWRRDDQLAVVHQGPATVDDVGHVPLALVGVGVSSGSSSRPMTRPGRSGPAETRPWRTSASGPRRGSAPASRPRSRSANRSCRAGRTPRRTSAWRSAPCVPEMEHVGVHQVDVLVVLRESMAILAVDLPREQSEALVAHLRAVQGAEPETEEVLGLEQLGQDHLAVVGRVGGVVANAAVVISETRRTGRPRCRWSRSATKERRSAPTGTARADSGSRSWPWPARMLSAIGLLLALAGSGNGAGRFDGTFQLTHGEAARPSSASMVSANFVARPSSISLRWNSVLS